jgi:hypothetical protein
VRSKIQQAEDSALNAELDYLVAALNAARLARPRQSSAVNVVLRFVRRLPYQLPRHHPSDREKSLASAVI